jgi:hypothetical protein
MTDRKQFLLGHAPLINRAELRFRSSRHADDRDRNQQREIRESALRGRAPRSPRTPLTVPDSSAAHV